MVSATQPLALSAFQTQGFGIFDSFLDADVVANLTEAIESLPPDRFADRKRRGVVFARRNLVDLDFIQALLLREEITNLVSSIARDSAPVRAILFDKTGPANWTVPWHQDRSIMVARRVDLQGFGPWSMKAGVVHVQPPIEILRRMFTLRCHLDACGADNGPLRVIANTHHRILDASEIDGIIANGAPTDCTTSIGGLVMMRPLILHSSKPATVPSHRRVIHLEFGPRELPPPVQWAQGARP